jgi:hypothetical protein
VFDERYICVIVADSDARIIGAFVHREDQIKDVACIQMFDIDRYGFHRPVKSGQILVRDISDYFQNPVGIAGNCACEDGSRNTLEAAGVRDDDALDIFYDGAAGLNMNRIRAFSEDFCCERGCVGKCDRFCASHGGNQLFS